MKTFIIVAVIVFVVWNVIAGIVGVIMLKHKDEWIKRIYGGPEARKKDGE